MTQEELKTRIKQLAPKAFKSAKKVETSTLEFDEISKFPQLKAVIVDLLTADFDSFLASIDWVAPRPTTFRINLKNNQEFYLIFNNRSWIAQVEGKKYYLLNLPEEEHAAEAISRILKYGSKSSEKPEENASPESAEEPAPPEENTKI